MDLIVKICGLSTAETLDAALDAGADLVGLVFFPPSPRFISIVDAVRPDWLQLHGKDSPARTAEVRARFPAAKVMKAVHISRPADLEAARSYSGSADRLLLDAKPPKGAVLPGGNGAAFDWRILKSFRPAVPYVLSGGLTADNVAEAIAISRPAGVDISSGVETAPGQKDPDLIRAFVAAARRADKSVARERVAS
jgi:phosphoribosylanthranilate isomerase